MIAALAISRKKAPTSGTTRKAFVEAPKRDVTACMFAIPTALVHESESGTNFSSATLIGYFIAKDFGRPSSNIRFRMLHAISASASCDSG